jgi:hypothetical protein
MSEEFANHYNDCITTIDHVEQMIAWLDKYRKTGDKRNLFAARDHETLIRKAIPKIKNANQSLITEPKNKAA